MSAPFGPRAGSDLRSTGRATSANIRAMFDRVTRLAAQVISQADRAHPADAVLREVLRAEHGLAREDGRKVRDAVFAHYRWLGWLTEEPLLDQIRRAVELDNRFQRAPGSFSDDDLVRRAVPEWTATVMRVSPEWVRALQTDPPLWLRARPGQAASLAAELGDCVPATGSAAPDALEYRGAQDLFRSRAFQAGRCEIQDVNSQRVGLICDPKPGQTWWDACAGEGGKTLHLSDLMNNKGLIWATDRAGWRLRRLQQRAARAGVFNYRATAWDGSERLPTRTRFDGVLLDAPCSGLGTWQRNPHARWTTTAEDIAELATVQLQLLRHAAPAVKPGGKLVYAVCTLAESETENVVREFSASAPEFGLAQAPLTLLPEKTRGNGMFIAVWQRVAA